MSASESQTATEVRAALDQLRQEVTRTGRRLSVLALARWVGMPNATLRRRFPDLCAELLARRQPAATRDGAEPDATGSLRQENGRLRRDNRDLTADLELAIANIQRLTLNNHRLRGELETAHRVSPIRRT